MQKATFNFHEETDAVINELKDYFRASSRAEIIRKAVALLDLVKDIQEKGGELAVVDKDSNTHKVHIR